MLYLIVSMPHSPGWCVVNKVCHETEPSLEDPGVNRLHRGIHTSESQRRQLCRACDHSHHFDAWSRRMVVDGPPSAESCC